MLTFSLLYCIYIIKYLILRVNFYWGTLQIIYLNAFYWSFCSLFCWNWILQFILLFCLNDALYIFSILDAGYPLPWLPNKCPKTNLLGGHTSKPKPALSDNESVQSSEKGIDVLLGLSVWNWWLVPIKLRTINVKDLIYAHAHKECTVSFKVFQFYLIPRHKYTGSRHCY